MTRRVLWERLDEPGWEAVCLERRDDGWEVEARFVGTHEGGPIAAGYRLVLDAHWVVLRAEASWGLGPSQKSLVLDRIGTRWRVNGVSRPDLDGCIDVDMGWSPFTNTLPIRRLAIGTGASHDVHVAWIREATLEVSAATQRYAGAAEGRIRFEAPDIGFAAELEVDAEGLVLRYPGLFRRVA